MLTENMRNSSKTVLILIFSIGLFLLLNLKTRAEIYKYVDEEGVTHYTDRPKNSNYKPLQIFNNFSYNKKQQAPKKDLGNLKPIIEEVAQRYGQDPKLIQSIIGRESNFNSNAVSPKGAIGLMQLMPQTAKRFNVKDPFNNKDNIEGGVAYLDYLMRLFDNDLELALAAYNAGVNSVMNYSGNPPFKETESYVKNVINSYKGERIEKMNKIYKIIKADGTILLTTNP